MLLVALFGRIKSSHWFDLALTTWMNTSSNVAFAYCAEKEIPVIPRNNSHGFICKDQTAYPGINYFRYNNVGDNKPLHFIHKLNKTLSFDWLLFGDDDTCFHMNKVDKLLTGLNYTFHISSALAKEVVALHYLRFAAKAKATRMYGMEVMAFDKQGSPQFDVRSVMGDLQRAFQ